MAVRMEHRPEMVGFFMFVILGCYLIKSCYGKALNKLYESILLFCIFIIWANTHASFLLGWFV
ncbi:MAG: hypothetical protein AAF984_01115, partial [Verrucomicrobiota bacterium]